MSYMGLNDGIYLVRQKAIEKISVDHYGVLDVGNRLDIAGITDNQPRVIHQTPPQIAVNSLQETGTWEVIAQAIDEPDAKERFWHAVKDPIYNTMNNNCEHFSRYVITGSRESIQLQTAAVVTGILVITIWGLSQQPRNNKTT